MGKPSPLYDVDIVLTRRQPRCPWARPAKSWSARTRPCPAACSWAITGTRKRPRRPGSDGLYHTGDTAWRDEDGYFWYVGRTDDVIKSSGYRIGPFEIESVIMELPYVLECGASPAPRTRSGARW